MLYDRDWRLHIEDPSTQEHRATQNEQKARAKITLRHLYSHSIIDNFCNIIIERAGLAPHKEHVSDISTDDELSGVVRELETSLTCTSGSQGLPSSQSPLMQALCECIGERLALIQGYGFAEWRSIHSVIHEYWPIYEEWLRHLPANEVLKYEADIFRFPPHGHVLELVQRWTLHMDKRYWDGYVEQMQSLETLQVGPGTWSEIKRITMNGELIMLESDLEFRGRLAKQIGLTVWLRWICNLPLASMQYAALQTLGDINTAIEICRIVLSPDSEINTYLYQKVMFIQLAIGILESIDGQLTHRSSDKWVVTERDEIFRSTVEVEANRWREEELPAYLECLAKIIVENSDEARLWILSVILTGIYQFDLRKDQCTARLRDEVIREVSEDNHLIPDLLIETLRHSSKAGLLNSARFIFQGTLTEEIATEVCHKVWNSFTSILGNSDFHWSNLHDSEDGSLAWHVAGALAHLPAPVTEFEESLKSLNPRSEGWSFSIDGYFGNQRKVVFYLIVGAMASEWLTKRGAEHVQDSSLLFESVWNHAHLWLRWNTNYLQESSVLVAELWARLSSVLPPDSIEQRAINGLELLDELEHVLTAANALALNCQGPGREGILPDTLQTHVRKITDQQLPLLVALGHTKPEVIKSYQDISAKLAPVQA